MNLSVPAQKPRFICEVCETEVPLDAKSCPNCGQVFAATLCPGCGFSGEAVLFVNGCPNCGYRFSSEKPPPRPDSPPSIIMPEDEKITKPPERRVWYSHISYYLLALAVFVALAAALIFNMF